ncbi:hypothetical protein F511_05110 [Dorcoceras hygrometricum]|uniref:Uncharacterized protein n=1 Tax=Dorcoceras hygrometricum TaxID=472368 RepID=A0A2Z7ALE6_9LAMI|nr:hypothetical protein F511_05110 [Dorcoceras hygrometricum]
MMRRRAEESADGLALMTSSVTSSQSADGLREQSQESAVVPEKSNAIVGVVTTGFECLPPSCDGLTGPDGHGPMISIG